MKNVQTDFFDNEKSLIGLSMVKRNQETLELTMLSLKNSKNRKL